MKQYFLNGIATSELFLMMCQMMFFFEDKDIICGDCLYLIVNQVIRIAEQKQTTTFNILRKIYGFAIEV